MVDRKVKSLPLSILVTYLTKITPFSKRLDDGLVRSPSTLLVYVVFKCSSSALEPI